MDGSPPVSGYWLKALRLRSFRNYSGLALDLGPEPVVLVGHNGAGKTNILEAISLLSPGQGLRRASYGDMARVGVADGETPEQAWSVNAIVEGPQGDVTIGTGPKPDARGSTAESASRIVRIDREPAATISALSDHVRVVWLTPAMDGLFTGSAGDRRRFLDRMVLTVDPSHGRRVNTFEKLMRDRNRLLSDGVTDDLWYDALEQQLAETGTAIAAARTHVVERLRAGIAEDRATAPEIAIKDAARDVVQDTRETGAGPGETSDQPEAFPWADVALDGTLENRISGAVAMEVEDAYRAILRESRPRDRAAGRTLDGPHRTDLLVRHGPKDIAARLASTGEQKALLIGLVLAHARLVADSMEGAAPLMLLDEVAAHLDETRRAALFQRLQALGGQAWMTGTDRAAFSALTERAQFVAIAAGRAEPEGMPC